MSLDVYFVVSKWELCVRLDCKSCLALDIMFEIIDGHGGGCDDSLINDTSYMKVIYRLEQCMQVPKFIWFVMKYDVVYVM